MAYPLVTATEWLHRQPIMVTNPRLAPISREDLAELETSPWKIPPLPDNVLEMIVLAGLGLMFDPMANEWVMVMPRCKGTYRFTQDFRRNYRQWVRKVERALEEDEKQAKMQAHHNGNVTIWDQETWR